MYLLGYDIGTSSVKASLVDASTGRAVASDFYPKQEAPIKALYSGWAEQDPDSWWGYLKEATASVVAKAGVAAADIAAIGFSYQMHGLVCIDRQAQAPARRHHLVRLPRRALWREGFRRARLRAVPEPSAQLARQLHRHQARVGQGERARGLRAHIQDHAPGDYIAMRMTGEIVSNPEGLSEMMLWDFKTDAPAVFLMDYFGFPADILPELRATFCEQGRLTPEAAAELGLAEGTPVTYRAGDQPNNALSLNVFEPGEIASTAGTSGVVYGVNGTVDYDPLSASTISPMSTIAAPRPASA